MQLDEYEKTLDDIEREDVKAQAEIEKQKRYAHQNYHIGARIKTRYHGYISNVDSIIICVSSSVKHIEDKEAVDVL